MGDTDVSNLLQNMTFRRFFCKRLEPDGPSKTHGGGRIASDFYACILHKRCIFASQPDTIGHVRKS